MASTEQNRCDCIRVLHKYKVDINQKTEENNAILQSATSLHIATYYGRLEAASVLIELGANPNIADKHGQTPLHLAVVQGNVGIIELLRKNGANTRVQDKNGNIPLAYCRDNVEVRKALTDPLLDVLMTLAKGKFYLEEKEACEVLEHYTTVLGGKLNTDIPDLDGSTPLLQTVIYGKANVAETFLKLGAKPELANAYSMNSYMWAKWNRNPRLFKLLCTYCPIDEQEINESLPLKRLNAVNHQVLFAGIPSLISPTSSKLLVRMDEFINTPTPLDQKSTESVKLIGVHIISHYFVYFYF